MSPQPPPAPAQIHTCCSLTSTARVSRLCVWASSAMAKVQKMRQTSSDKTGTARLFRESCPESYKPVSRSCRGCHQRKVRCDHGQPCTNCSRYGISCVYPTKNTGVTRKSPSLQSISTSLERLEVLLSRLADPTQVITRPSAGSGDDGDAGRSRGQFQAQSGAKFDATEHANQCSSSQPSYKSTWELLLHDGRVAMHSDKLNTEDQRQNVSSAV